ncbi:MAG: hypothetical protein VX874_06205 [Pseudomonadota bacterium]|nr:hypothetical protein [Pseudomonadota bacterium]
MIDVYNYSDSELNGRMRQAKAEVPQNWDRGWSMGSDTPVSVPEADASGDSGMFCRFYTPKMDDGDDPGGVCPPVLAFRGSEMNDADVNKIAIHTEIDADIEVRAFGFNAYSSNSSIPIPVFSPDERVEPSSTRAEIRALGYIEQALVQPSTGQHTFTLDLGPITIATANVNWTGSASLFFGNSGDWPTNISQALGHFPPQYQEAIQAGERAAQDAMANWDGKLIIVGHSLGGGLASLAALAAKQSQPDLDLRCDIYNAAGLHEVSASRANSSRSNANGAGIASHSVSGEILTSLQTPGLIPIISDVFRWGGVTLPSAIPTPAPTRGVSPGGPPSMMQSHLERAPEWSPLPILFPLEQQTLVQGDFGTINDIFTASASAPNFSAFVTNIIDVVFNRFGDDSGRIRVRNLLDAMERYDTEFQAVGAQMGALIGQAPPLASFPTVNLGDTDYLNNQAEPYVNGLIRDSIEFAQVAIASVDYHLWDACSYTFLFDRPS